MRGSSARLARLALAELGLDIERLELIQDAHNTTYRAHTPDGPIALRIAHPQITPDQVEHELAWVRALAADGRVRVPTVLGSCLIADRVCTASRWLPGRRLGRGLRPVHMETLGRAQARLHLQAESWNPPAGWSRAQLDQIWGQAPSPLPLLAPTTRTVFAACTPRLQGVLQALQRDPWHAVHGDLHQGNLRFTAEGEVGVLDFDSVAVGHPAQDLAITRYYTMTHPRRAALWKAHEEGYRQCRAWPTQPPELEALLVWRTLTVLAGASSHPSQRVRERVPELLPKWTATVEAWLRGAAPWQEL